MPRSRKTNLRDAVASGAIEFLVYCDAKGCEHGITVPLQTAMNRWGLDTGLNVIAISSTDCGSRMMEARFVWPVTEGG